MIRLILFLTALSAWSQIPLDSGAAGVGGASNLTTAGAIPYVSAPGTLNQDPTALFWDAANDRLGIKANNPLATLDVYLSPTAGRFAVSDNFGVLQVASVNSAFSAVAPFRIQGLDIRFVNQFVEFGRFASTTGNLLIGTTTDSNFKLDVATSGSAGTARFYDQASPLGSTKVVVRAGAGQSGNLQEWQVSAGAVAAYISGSGNIVGTAVVSSQEYFDTTSVAAIGGSAGSSWGGLMLGSGGFLRWRNNASVFAGTSDLSLSRASAGVLRVGDGGSNANGQVSATRVLHAGVLVAALPAAAAGNAGSIQYVTDANATTIGSTVAGGGANKVMVWSDGAAWKIFAN